MLRNLAFLRGPACSFANLTASPKSILLSLHSPFLKYCFLAIQPSRINQQMLPLARTLASPALDSFLQTTRAHLHLLAQVRRENFGFGELVRLEEGGAGQSSILMSNAEAMREWGGQFRDLGTAIKEGVTCNNFREWMEMCLQLEVIDVSIWAALLKQCRTGFILLSPALQLQTLQMIHQYVTTKFMKFTHVPSQFLYRENNLSDLGNLPELLVHCLHTLIAAPPQWARPSFIYLIELLFKISKTCLVNFMALLSHYAAHQPQYLQLLEGAPLATHINFLRFYALLGIASPSQLARLDQSLLGELQRMEGSLAQDEVLQIVSSWSILAHHNQQIYEQFIRGALLNGLQSRTNVVSAKWATILFNLIASGIDDEPVMEALMGHISLHHPLDGKIMHIVNHYLSIKFGYARLSSYPLCTQHPFTHTILQSAPKVYSPCMEREKKQGKSFSQHEVTYEKEIGLEGNPPQDFWLQALKEVFEEWSRREPDPSNKIFFNFPFCVFQLDALVVVKGRYVAFELNGTHYLHKDGSGQLLESLHGKKHIKKLIVQAYGIKICTINSAGLIERTISAFQDIHHAKKYLGEKLSALLATA